MVRSITLPFLIAVVPALVFAQTDASNVSWFPRNTLFVPFISSHDEPLMGLEQQLGSSALKVGIGNAVDLIEYRCDNDTLRWGADFFSYSLASTIRDVRLKIDAADGFFGMHFAWTNGSPWMFRLRAIHQSAHFVDGHYNLAAQSWDSQPIPFSRNYGDVAAAYRLSLKELAIRAYGGPSFAVYNNPKDIRRWGGFAGCEIHTLSENALYAAFNISFLGVPVYNGSGTLAAGIKFGDWDGRGVRLYAQYYSGLDLFGQYYKNRTKYFSLGFAIDFW